MKNNSDIKGDSPRAVMNGKPVVFRENTRTILTDPSPAFGEKLLCDGLTFNAGDGCAFQCSYCYTEAVTKKYTKAVVDAANERFGLTDPESQLEYQNLVIRRRATVETLRGQLLKGDGSRRYADPEDHRVIFGYTVVDAAANMELLRETAELCRLILEHTGWQIRLLSKSNLLARLVDFLPARDHQRIIFGFSTGILDERVSSAVESGTARIGQRLKALHWLQDRGFRTFGMICPSLPQADPEAFSREAAAAIRVDRCEHVWAEPINVRGQSMFKTVDALRREGLNKEADRLLAVCGPGAKDTWEDYARQTFLAHTRQIPADKLRFLQYPTRQTAGWWADQRSHGAVLLGSEAIRLGLTA